MSSPAYQARYVRQKDVDDNDDDFTMNDDEDATGVDTRRTRICCFLGLVPGHRRPIIIFMLILDLLTVGAVAWPLARVISDVPGKLVDNEPQLFWTVVGAALVPLVAFVWTTAIRMHHHYVLYRQHIGRARQKTALWSFRVAILALFHSLAIAWMLLAWLTMQAAGNASIITGNTMSLAVTLQWRLASASHAIVFCIVAVLATMFNVLLALCSMYRAARHIAVLIEPFEIRGGERRTTIIPMHQRPTGSSAATIRNTNAETLARMRANNSAVPYIQELKTYTATTTLVGTDDEDGPRTPRSVDEQLDDYEHSVASDNDDNDVQTIQHIKVPRQRRHRKASNSGATRKLLRQDGRNTASDSAVRSSLDDSRPGYSGKTVDNMY